MILDPVTVRWAGALYDLASKRGALASVSNDVERLGTEVARPEVRRIVVNPRLDRATRRAAVEGGLRGAHQLTQNFVDLAFERGRAEVMLEVAAAFRRRTRDEAGEVEGVVETARPMPAAELERVAADFGRALGKKLILKNRVVPELVGGARVIAGNRMLDGSITGRLDALRRRMQEVPLPG